MLERNNIHPSVKIYHPELVNIYDSIIGENTKIAAFVEIGKAQIGANCKIEAFAFIPPNTIIEDYVFIGPHVTICNDKYPDLLESNWKIEGVTIKKGARIGAGAVLLPGVTVGERSLVGAGAVVTKDVVPYQSVLGNPAYVYANNHVFSKVLADEYIP